MTAIMKAGRYEIVGELGRGAMGVVYRATDPVIGRPVAVKTIKLSEEGSGLSRSELLNRFQTEARAAGLLAHPNIVVVFDAGEEEGLYYITMELVEGKSLQAAMDGGHAFPLPRILRIMEQICSALQFAHDRNVVHRDIKPANIMLTGDDTVKVTDFGTAKILQFGTVQQTAHVMGTPSYMSPEQVKGRAVDGRSDIFSLGVMLYEMLTGEKPFPGENITTVIYKIVNEEPVSPRQIDPSIHPGMSAAVMKALSKEPETRYQNSRELLEDLRNYRNTPGNPQSTMVMGAQKPTTATAAMIGGLKGMRPDDPTRTPVPRPLLPNNPNAAAPAALRRTGPVTPYEEPKKGGWIGTTLAGLLLLGVICYGVYKLRPVYEDVRQDHEGPSTTSDSAAAPGDSAASSTGSTANPEASDNEEVAGKNDSNVPEDATPQSTAPHTAVDSQPEKVTAKKPELLINPKAAALKKQIEGDIAEKGLTGRAKVQAVGNTLVLSGRLRPMEHGGLLKLLRDAPADVRVVDHIEYEDSPLPASDTAEGGHPVPAPGRAAIHIVTDVIGATVSLHGPAGRVLNRCQTPCSFNSLFPARYSLEIRKDGYQPVQTALQIRANEVSDQKISMESLEKGLFVKTEPAGADVFINGAKQSGQTPVTLPLAPGQYNLVIRQPGYEPYSGTVQVKDNVQTQLGVKLSEKSQAHIAFAQVTTNPRGAEIWIDGNATGKSTPSRIQLPAGLHTIGLKLNGYQLAQRKVQVSEGGTVTIAEALRPQ